jgi:hypothetical protein
MSVHALLGLLALNLWFLVVGAFVVFALRGWTSWGELARLAGLGYILGFAALATMWIFELAVGIPFGFPVIFVTGVVLAALGWFIGARRGRRVVPGRPPGLPALSWAGAVGAALTLVYLEAAFRAARLAGLYEFDAWDFWVPKAKAIYFFGGFDHQFFRELINQSYPPAVPVIEAAGFHFMGSADVVTVHVQFWFLFAGFVAAVVGLLSGRVPAVFVWLPLLLVLATPYLGPHLIQPTADFLLDELLALAALLLALWLRDRRDWQLAAVAVLSAGAALTKREGYVFALSALAAAGIVTVRQWRSAWPRLLAVGVFAVIATLPWRVLLAVRGLSGGGPEAGGTGLFEHGDRAWPSLRLALTTLFDYDTWLVVAPLLLVAVVVAFVGGARTLPLYTTLLILFSLAAYTYSTWAFPSLGISTNPALNPIVRLTGELVLLTPVLAPLLLERGWRAAR